MTKLSNFKNIIRISVYPVITFISFWIFIKFTKLDNFNKKEILGILISVIVLVDPQSYKVFTLSIGFLPMMPDTIS